MQAKSCKMGNFGAAIFAHFPILHKFQPIPQIIQNIDKEITTKWGIKKTKESQPSPNYWFIMHFPILLDFFA